MGSFGGWVEPFDGRQNVKFDDYEVRDSHGDKGLRHWVLMKFSGDEGDMASISFNLWPDTEEKGCQTGNRISMRVLTEFWYACGLDKATLPDDSIDKIKEALEAYKGEITVNAEVFKDGRGYNALKKFTRAK